MTTEPIDACTAEIAGVRERYTLEQAMTLKWYVHDRKTWDEAFSGTEVECQAWIDREAARACLEAIRTPTREMYAAMGDAIVKGGLSTVYHHDHVADVIWSAGITTAITKQEEG